MGSGRSRTWNHNTLYYDPYPLNCCDNYSNYGHNVYSNQDQYRCNNRSNVYSQGYHYNTRSYY
jgi:hypothetical protein